MTGSYCNPEHAFLVDRILWFVSGKGYSLWFYWHYQKPTTNLSERYIIYVISMNILNLKCFCWLSYKYFFFLYLSNRRGGEQPWRTYVKFLCSTWCSCLWKGKITSLVFLLKGGDNGPNPYPHSRISTTVLHYCKFVVFNYSKVSKYIVLFVLNIYSYSL